MKAGMPGGRKGMPGGRRSEPSGRMTTGVMGVEGNCSAGLRFEVVCNCGAAAASLLVVLELLEVVVLSS